MGGLLSSFLQDCLGETTSSNDPTRSSTTIASDYVVPQLPSNATRHRVRNVYDGDTFTLVDGTRVRLVGIDTPEIKQQQPGAAAAKAFTKRHCPHQQDVFLVRVGQDKYQRWLAYVYAPSQGGGGYIHVNQGLVAEGLAYVYRPDTASTPDNWDSLVQLQRQARQKRLGLWKTFRDSNEKVVKTANGSAYHWRSCEHVAHIRHLTELSKSQALDQGLHPCRLCMG